MRKVAFALAICGCAVILFLLRAHSRHSIGSTEVFWSEHDIEAFKIAPQTELREVAETIYQQPQFYTGTMPLKCTDFVEEVIPPQVSLGVPGGIVVLEQYAGFKNMYVYGDSVDDKLRGFAVGAITMSEAGEILAEAKFVERTSDGIEIEEQHYVGCRQGTCSLSFKATSSIDRSGIKRGENNRLGQKSKDYYFRWPMGLR